LASCAEAWPQADLGKHLKSSGNIFNLRRHETNVESQGILRQITRMATLSLTDEQVVELVKQLTPQCKQRVLADLTAERDQWWHSAVGEGEKDMRQLAVARGLNWDTMTEAQRETFVDDLLHES
jgi:hypothetical protein